MGTFKSYLNASQFVYSVLILLYLSFLRSSYENSICFNWISWPCRIFKFMDRLPFWKTEFPILNNIPNGWLFIILLLVFIVLVTLLNSDSNNNQ